MAYKLACHTYAIYMRSVCFKTKTSQLYQILPTRFSVWLSRACCNICSPWGLLKQWPWVAIMTVSDSWLILSAKGSAVCVGVHSVCLLMIWSITFIQTAVTAAITPVESYQLVVTLRCFSQWIRPQPIPAVWYFCRHLWLYEVTHSHSHRVKKLLTVLPASHHPNQPPYTIFGHLYYSLPLSLLILCHLTAPRSTCRYARCVPYKH